MAFCLYQNKIKFQQISSSLRIIKHICCNVSTVEFDGGFEIMPIRKMKQEKYNGISELYRGSDGKVTGLYIAYRNADGKVVRERVVDTLNPDEALLKLNQIKFETKRAKSRGEIATSAIIKKNPLITELADVFFTAKSKNSNNKKEQQRFNNHIKSSIEKMKCDTLKPMDIQGIQDSLKNKGLSPKTINCATDLFRSIMRFGLENQYFSREYFAFDSYKPLQVDNEVDRVFTGVEVRELIESITEPRMKMFIAMGYFTAQRPESLLRLQRKDIENERIRISIIKKQKAHYIPIHPELKPALMDWIKDLDTDDFIFHIHGDSAKSLSYERLQNEASILFEPFNLPLYWREGMTPAEVLEAKSKAFKEHRKKWVSLYTLRHSAATNVLEATGDISTAQAILNHTSTKTTQRYAKTTEGSKARGINAL
jgi:integrase